MLVLSCDFVSLSYRVVCISSKGHTCQPPESKNLETSRNLQGQPAEPCQQQGRASEGCGIKPIFRSSVGGRGGGSTFNRNFNISLRSTEKRKSQNAFDLIYWESDTKRQGESLFYF